MDRSGYITAAGTGNQSIEQGKKIIYPFDKYEIEVMVTDTGKFIGITGIRINASFLKQAQKLSTSGYHDVDKYYQVEDK
jgi:hypothetical protein